MFYTRIRIQLIPSLVNVLNISISKKNMEFSLVYNKQKFYRNEKHRIQYLVDWSCLEKSMCTSASLPSPSHSMEMIVFLLACDN